MSFSYNLNTNVGMVRLNIGDTSNSPAAIFSDEEITSILSQSDNDPNAATGRALIIIANTRARLATYKSAKNYSEDLRSIAKELRDQAKMWLEMANVPYDAVAEQTFGPVDRPFDGPGEKQYLDREDLRDQ